jgi:hypothetical protein
LSFDAESGPSLPLGRNAIVGNSARHRSGCHQTANHRLLFSS